MDQNAHTGSTPNWQQLGVLHCTKCNLKTSDAGLFQAHNCRPVTKLRHKASITYSPEVNKFLCSICNFYLPASTIEEHLESHVSLKPYTCKHCQLPCDSQTKLLHYCQNSNQSTRFDFFLNISNQTKEIILKSQNYPNQKEYYMPLNTCLKSYVLPTLRPSTYLPHSVPDVVSPTLNLATNAEPVNLDNKLLNRNSHRPLILKKRKEQYGCNHLHDSVLKDPPSTCQESASFDVISPHCQLSQKSLNGTMATKTYSWHKPKVEVTNHMQENTLVDGNQASSGVNSTSSVSISSSSVLVKTPVDEPANNSESCTKQETTSSNENNDLPHNYLCKIKGYCLCLKCKMKWSSDDLFLKHIWTEHSHNNDFTCCPDGFTLCNRLKAVLQHLHLFSNVEQVASLTDTNNTVLIPDSLNSVSIGITQTCSSPVAALTSDQPLDLSMVEGRNSYYQCGFTNCFFSSITPVDLLYHSEVTHGLESNFPCIYCGFSGTTISALLEHLGEHIGCDDANIFFGSVLKNSSSVCNFETKDINSLLLKFEDVLRNYNDMTHISFACNTCQTIFSSLTELKDHMIKFLLKVVSCKHCRSYFLDVVSWQKHRAQEHPNEPRLYCINSKLLCDAHKKYQPIHGSESQCKTLLNLDQQIYPSTSIAANVLELEKTRYLEENQLKSTDSFSNTIAENNATVILVLPHNTTCDQSNEPEPIEKLLNAQATILPTNVNISDPDHSDNQEDIANTKDTDSLPETPLMTEHNEDEKNMLTNNIKEKFMPPELSQISINQTTDNLLCSEESTNSTLCTYISNLPSQKVSTKNSNLILSDKDKKNLLSSNNKEKCMPPELSQISKHQTTDNFLCSEESTNSTLLANISNLPSQKVPTKNSNRSLSVEDNHQTNLNLVTSVSKHEEMKPLSHLCGEEKIDVFLKPLYKEIEGFFVCKQCQLKFSSLKRLHGHIFSCIGKMKLVHCPHCYFQEEQQKLLSKHIKNEHPDEDSLFMIYFNVNVVQFMNTLESSNINIKTFTNICTQFKSDSEAESEKTLKELRTKLMLEKQTKNKEVLVENIEEVNSVLSVVKENILFKQPLQSSSINSKKSSIEEIVPQGQVKRKLVSSDKNVSSKKQRSCPLISKELVDVNTLNTKSCEKNVDNVHIIKRSGLKPGAKKPTFNKYSCTLGCNFSTKWNEAVMVNHLKNKHPYCICGYCRIVYFKLTYLNNHLKFVHRDKPPLINYDIKVDEYFKVLSYEQKNKNVQSNLRTDFTNNKETSNINVSKMSSNEGSSTQSSPSGKETSSVIQSPAQESSQQAGLGERKLSFEDYPFKCTICSHYKKSVSDVEKHYKRKHVKKKVIFIHRKYQLVYSITGEMYSSKLKHVPSAAKYFCYFCSFHHQSRSDVESHVVKCHGGSPVRVFAPYYSDSIDKDASPTSEKTNNKALNISTGTIYRCCHCHETSKSHFSFRLHLGQHEGFSCTSVLTSTPGLLLCSVCGYVATSHKDLGSHTEEHLKERQYVCSLCTFDSHTRAGLSYHIKHVHHSEDSSPFIINRKQQIVLKPVLVNLDPTVVLVNCSKYPDYLRNLLLKYNIKMLDVEGENICANILQQNNEKYFDVRTIDDA